MGVTLQEESKKEKLTVVQTKRKLTRFYSCFSEGKLNSVDMDEGGSFTEVHYGNCGEW